ncbi:MAG: hypothetical protein FWG14_07515 [Peptococcaceae bacterium]|nr:hypothetical protein [Peptococcaceae bacterium]
MVNKEAIVSIIKRISTRNEPPGKKTLQKTVYLIEAKGVDLGCDYNIHFFGPYSHDLDYAVRELSDEGLLSIQYSNTEHKISVSNENYQETYENDIINSIIDEFGKDTPSELELLTTALYVYIQLDKNKSAITEGVQKIKGNKYSKERIQNAIERLRTTEFITG